jgi:hypothetical protein
MTTDDEKKDTSSGEELPKMDSVRRASGKNEDGGFGIPATPCIHQELARELRKSLVILREKMESGEINPLAWMWHFSSFPAARVLRCEDCADYEGCEYDHDMAPLDCFSKTDRHQSDRLTTQEQQENKD